MCRPSARATVDGRLVVQITIPPGSGIKHFRPGSGGVAIDIVDPPKNAAPAPAQAAVPAAPAPAPAAPQAPSPPKQQEPAKPEASPKPEAAAKPQAQATKKQVLTPPATTTAPAPNAAIPAPPPPSASPQIPVASQPLNASPSEVHRGGVTVEAQEPAAAAVYTRAGFLYVVFGRPLELDGRVKVDTLVPGLGGPETVPLRGATAFRMALPDGMEPTVTRDGNTWRIGLGPRASTRPEGLPVDAQRDFPLGARLVVGVPDARQVIQINDPVVGDQLLVVPLPNPGQAVADPHGFSQLRLLPAAQGIVVQPLEDTVAVRPIRDGVEVTSAGGLRLSPPGDLTGVSATRLSGRGREPAATSGLFNLAKWRGGPTSEFNKLRQQAQQAVLAAPEVERDRARLDLAHFYFAHGLAAESLGLLGMLAGNQPDLETRPEFQALRGAARVLYGEPQLGAEDLANPALDRQEEATLWRAAASAERGDWPAAARDFERVRGMLDGYPDPFYTKLAAMAVKARLNTGDRAGAARQLDAIAKRTGGEFEKKPIGQFLRGQIRLLAGNKDEAMGAFRAAAASNDRLYRTRAELALVDLEMENGTLGAADAVARLERLRFAWRGDDLELDILDKLGATYMKAHNYAEGFNTIRQAAELFPDSPRAAQMTTRHVPELRGPLYQGRRRRLVAGRSAWPVRPVQGSGARRAAGR